jgi:septal ring factor EnvC (AmiA/AmiB activator)
VLVADGNDAPHHETRRGRSRKDVDGLRDLTGRVARHFSTLIASTGQVAPGARTGYLYNRDDLDAVSMIAMWATNTETCFMNVIEELQNNYDEAARLWAAYKQRLHEFRSEIKNDVASLEAAARRTTDSAVKISKAYAEVFAQLNGEEMQRAIENAERLARALDAVAHLQATKLTFAVFGAEGANGARQVPPP